MLFIMCSSKMVLPFHPVYFNSGWFITTLRTGLNYEDVTVQLLETHRFERVNSMDINPCNNFMPKTPDLFNQTGSLYDIILFQPSD